MNEEEIKNFFYKISGSSDVIIKFVKSITVPNNEYEASMCLYDKIKPPLLEINKKILNKCNVSIKATLLHEIGHLKHGTEVGRKEGEFLAYYWALNKSKELDDLLITAKLEERILDYGNPKTEFPECYRYTYNKAIETGLITSKEKHMKCRVGCREDKCGNLIQGNISNCSIIAVLNSAKYYGFNYDYKLLEKILNKKYLATPITLQQVLHSLWDLGLNGLICEKSFPDIVHLCQQKTPVIVGTVGEEKSKNCDQKGHRFLITNYKNGLFLAINFIKKESAGTYWINWNDFFENNQTNCLAISNRLIIGVTKSHAMSSYKTNSSPVVEDQEGTTTAS